MVGGVLDLLRGGAGSPESERWAKVCSGSGNCIPACPEGVNPRFMLALTRVAMQGMGAAMKDPDVRFFAAEHPAAMLVALPSSIAFGVLVYSAIGPEHAGSGALAGIVGAAVLGVVAPLVGRNGGGKTTLLLSLADDGIAQLVALQKQVLG